MKEYLGIKSIKASTEMTREEYCKYRGWTVPTDENRKDIVYLVEYEVDTDTKPNHPKHDGYISMSPKSVFDKSYKEVKTFKDINDSILLDILELPNHQKRVIEEASELDTKINKLDDFIINNSLFKTLSEDEQTRLIQQVRAMSYYFTILVERINNF